MPKFSAILPTPETSGDFEEMIMAAGESAGLVEEIKPAAEIVREMMEEAHKIITQRLSPMTDRPRERTCPTTCEEVPIEKTVRRESRPGDRRNFGHS